MATLQIRKKRSKAKLDYSYPVLVVSRSNKNVTAQVIDNVTKKTLFTVNSNKMTGKTKTEQSTEVGKEVAAKLKNLKIEKVLFNRNGFLYHGRIKAIAEGVRENGVQI